MTAQLSDTLYYCNNAHSICNEPLSNYLKDHSIKFFTPSTALNRGYRAGWLLSENKLYLIDLKAHLDHDNHVGLSHLFPQQEKVFADWYSGIIKINQGDLIQYIHRGYNSIYERNWCLTFEKGILIDEYIIDNTLPPVLDNSFSAGVKRAFLRKLRSLIKEKEITDDAFFDFNSCQ